MLERLEHCGKLTHDSTIPGNRRADNVAAAHPNGLQLARDRFMLIKSMLAFRGIDDTLGGLYEIRGDAYDGPVLKEGVLVESIDDWDPLRDGSRHVRQHGHFTAWGVPKGAVVKGTTPAHANVFAVKSRRCARMFGPDRTYLLWFIEKKHPELHRLTQGVDWMQFRLTNDGNDIEVLKPLTPLRQRGFETGPRICAVEAEAMNNPYVSPVPFNDDATEWIDCMYFDHARIAPCKYRFTATTGGYEWVETGPLIEGGLFEPSVARYHDSWIIAARPNHEAQIAWMRCEDPFGRAPKIQWGPGPRSQNRTPLSVYACPDGVLRLLTGDPDASPYGQNRNPLYLWDVDPDKGFALSNRRTVYDTFAAGVPIPKDHHPIVDMPKILPHAGGTVQCLVHRVRSAALLANDPDYGMKKMTPDDFNATSIYYARMHYARPLPGAWDFRR